MREQNTNRLNVKAVVPCKYKNRVNTQINEVLKHVSRDNDTDKSIRC